MLQKNHKKQDKIAGQNLMAAPCAASHRHSCQWRLQGIGIGSCPGDFVGRYRKARASFSAACPTPNRVGNRLAVVPPSLIDEAFQELVGTLPAFTRLENSVSPPAASCFDWLIHLSR